ncbi:hypothetical protein CSC70_06180 [Pseudoxanthomonas kalamensis DSM 18571]|uniref:DUF1302 domain-containing protein n=1 Tax=Pseudoxanthomonas kalamensis TaxID=289483 RepID=UPI0013911DCA|nr:DUF1302 domain-containing protein [Pseudoxanthomonas kalamensis]KAF1711554.1 hypothetical protein CSC70_06180 [Pseudoxanthomonas kalamensis DSM 18571]
MSKISVASWPRSGVLAVACASALAATPAIASQITTSNPDLQITWDNTIKYSAGWRVEESDPGVADNTIGVQANTNDGDLNFDRGLISNRLDILTEFDLRYRRNFGFRITGAAWYDSVYHQSNDNPAELGGALVNSRSVGPREFTEATKKLHGEKAELLDAFVYGNFSAGDASINLKAGRFTQLYGESLFFGSNGIAAAQTTLDLVKALSVPNSQFKEIMRPVGQISTQVQLSTKVSFGAYYQFEWERTRIPGAGSYFSFADFVDKGGESVILGPGQVVFRGKDIEASNSGQGGVQLRVKSGDAEFGFYAAQFHDKMPQFYLRPGVNVEAGSIGDYVEVFAEDIRTLGASISTLVGDANVAAEVSVRDNMPLVASGNAVILPGDAISDGGDNAAFPVGKTLHANISVLSVLGGSALWDGATLLGEVAFNRRLSVEKNEGQLDPHATRDATALQFLFTPQYFQVFSGVDLSVPIGASLGVSGRSSVNGVLFPSEHGGTVSVGLMADVRRTWQAGISFSHYYGKAGSIVLYDTAVPELSYRNFHGDRDFVALSIQRTF